MQHVAAPIFVGRSGEVVSLFVLLPVVVGYLLGSIPFPVIISRLVKGIDLRQHGSGNMGARNAGRVLGERWFPLVLALDAGKGALAAYVGLSAFQMGGLDPLVGTVLGALAAALGHCYPVFAGFRGGLGLAATGGGLLVISPLLLGAALSSAALFWLLSRDLYIGVAITTVLFPTATLFVGFSWVLFLLFSLWGLLIFVVHWSRVARWLAARRGG